MATTKQRFWYLYNGNLAVVEDGHNKTVGTTTVTIDTISAALPLRINTIAMAEAFTIDLGQSSELPIQFHEALIFKAIVIGYQDPRNFNPQQAQYFMGEYENAKREAKKYAKRNTQTGGIAVPQEF